MILYYFFRRYITGTYEVPDFFVENSLVLFVSSYYDSINFTTGCTQQKLAGGFKYFLFSPLFGEDFQFD